LLRKAFRPLKVLKVCCFYKASAKLIAAFSIDFPTQKTTNPARGRVHVLQYRLAYG
jgi:hypothetical protein